MSNLFQALLFLLVPALLGVLAFLVRDVLRKMSGSGVILLAGLGLVFLGERMLGVGDARAPVSLFGVAVVLGALGLRIWALRRSEGDRAHAHRQALIFTAVAVGGLALYGLTLPTVTDALGLDEEAASAWRTVGWSLFPIAILAGVVPVFMLDRVLASHPRVLPAGAARRAATAGLGAALATALIFPVNYLAASHDREWDVAYFRTTRPGTSTRALVSTLTEPVEALLFFPSGSDVGREVRPYFDQLAAISGGRLTIRTVDQALDPALAESLRIRENGFVALRMGEATQTVRIGDDIDRARRELSRLDAKVLEHLTKLTRGDRQIYLLIGHGEASVRDRDRPFRDLSQFKDQILGPLNLRTSNFGLAEGSTDAVPDDAGAVVVASPETELMPEELETLKRYWDGGGRLLVLADPADDPPAALLAHLGLKAGEGLLAHESRHLRQTLGLADRALLYSNRYGSHASMKTLARAAVPIFVPGVRAIEKLDGASTEVTTLVRSYPDTWADLDGDRVFDEGEESRAVYDLAVAVTGPQGARAVVVGDVNLLSGTVLRQSDANKQFAYDVMRWLVGEEELAGSIESEEDVRIVHTRDDDQLWFYGTIFAVPLLVLGFGFVFIRVRGRKA